MGKPNVVIFRGPDGGEEKSEAEQTLASALAAQGLDVLLVPHLYNLSAGDEAAAKLVSLGEPLVVASWLHPRPAEWTLRYLGFEGEVNCVNIAAFCCPETCAKMIMALVGDVSGEGRVEEISHETHERWYPVLDYSRCTSCGQCFEFCLFGVYESGDDGRVTVKNPGNCKPGCPACARVCPAGAIMFPHYERDEAIAGAPGKEIAGDAVDRDALVAAVRSAAATGCDCSKAVEEALSGSPNKSSPVCDCDCDCSTDGIDDLIDALDKLDV